MKKGEDRAGREEEPRGSVLLHSCGEVLAKEGAFVMPHGRRETPELGSRKVIFAIRTWQKLPNYISGPGQVVSQ